MKKKQGKQKILKKPLPKTLDHNLGWYWGTLKKCFYATELKKLGKWFRGQTCAIDSKNNNEIVYYSWDVQRYLDYALDGKPLIWD